VKQAVRRKRHLGFNFEVHNLNVLHRPVETKTQSGLSPSYLPPQQLCGIAILRTDRAEWPRIGVCFAYTPSIIIGFYSAAGTGTNNECFTAGGRVVADKPRCTVTTSIYS
jgi:hypothetical protein